VVTGGHEDAGQEAVRSVIVRAAQPPDAPAVRLLVRTAFQHYVARIGREPAPMTVDFAQVVAGGDAWVAETGGRLAGVLVLETAADHLLIDTVAVVAQQQGSGVGRALLAFAEQQARARGLTEVRLYTNEAMTENLEYYPRRGYRETHRAVGDGYCRVYFSKAVLPAPRFVAP
jgi:N-acetylglutamate synthase-like GNAT family acetyltransferase